MPCCAKRGRDDFLGSCLSRGEGRRFISMEYERCREIHVGRSKKKEERKERLVYNAVWDL